MSHIDREFFFSRVRNLMASGRLRQSQVDGLNVIIDEWSSNYADRDDRWLAYMLATVSHETDQTFQPIEEYGKGRGRRYGVPDEVTGQIYYGRGFVQLTWKQNYKILGQKIDEDLVHHPELALDTKIATQILFIGMIEGLFTRKKLSDYFNSRKADWVNARRIINGLDKAKAIAALGQNFYGAISYAN